MDLIQRLRADAELKDLRLKWKEVFDTPFPPYNWDEYGGIDDYKEKIRSKLKNTTSQQAGGIFVEKIMLKVVLAIKVICLVTWFVTVMTYVAYTACQWIRYAL